MADIGRAGIIFDFDDTLVYSHELFQMAQQQFYQIMEELGLFDEELPALLEQQDIANVQATGYLATDCFPRALVQVYQKYCHKYGYTPQNEEQEQLWQLGYQPFLQIPRHMEGAEDLLKKLQGGSFQGFRRILFTQGEEEIQYKRVQSSGFATYFDYIRIVRLKDVYSLKALLKDEGLDAARSWYVGNSLRADINPAIAAGLQAVHFDLAAWSYEQDIPYGAYHTISRLEQFENLVRGQLVRGQMEASQ